MPASAAPKVFVVIPVFNRIAETLSCIGDLRRQRYPNLEIVVVDGGSTDDTVTRLDAMQDVHLIAGVGEQWWTGATWYGIEHALQHGRDDDFVMMLNNDTAFGAEMIEVLVSESRRLDAAVAPIARAADGSVVNGGVWIDWGTYFITQGTEEARVPRSSWAVDALEGRGTLLPLAAIRRAGNVNHVRLPHYAADYEFTLRLARHGCPLFMTNKTSIEVDWDVPSLSLYSAPASFRRVWWELVDQRSFSNARIHFTLIDLAAPAHGRWRAKAWFLRHYWDQVARRTRIRHVVGIDSVVRDGARRAVRPVRRVRRAGSRQWWKLRN
jgi:GT2 family glycosyltransferase